jgi:hypothetical protein
MPLPLLPAVGLACRAACSLLCLPNSWCAGLAQGVGAGFQRPAHRVSGGGVTLFALWNLWMVRKQLMAALGAVRPKTA